MAPPWKSPAPGPILPHMRRILLAASALGWLCGAAAAGPDARSAVGGFKFKAGESPEEGGSVVGRAVAAPRAALAPKSRGVVDYLSRKGRSWEPGARDDGEKLFRDAVLAIAAYRSTPGEGRVRDISFKDEQKMLSVDFYMNTGGGKLNPDGAQTQALEKRLDALIAEKPITQVDLLYEALIAAEGNVTMAFGSLSELFCRRRADYIPAVGDIQNVAGKTYYRYAGAFISLHGPVVETLGKTSAYANMAGNPIVYAGAEVVGWWARFIATGQAGGGIDTLNTLGPEGNGNIVDKSGEMNKGFDAGRRLRGAFPGGG